MPEVKCKVQPCHYWKEGDFCTAKSITVDFNQPHRPGRLEAGDLDFDTKRTGSRGGHFEPVGPGLADTGLLDFEAGDLTGSLGRTGSEQEAKTSRETLCATFKPKNRQSRH